MFPSSMPAHDYQNYTIMQTPVDDVELRAPNNLHISRNFIRSPKVFVVYYSVLREVYEELINFYYEIGTNTFTAPLYLGKQLKQFNVKFQAAPNYAHLSYDDLRVSCNFIEDINV